MKTILINAYEGTVLFENVPNNAGRDHLINLATHALNERPGGRPIYSLSNVEYVANPILFEDEVEAWNYEQDLPQRLTCRVHVYPNLVLDYKTFLNA